MEIALGIGVLLFFLAIAIVGIRLCIDGKEDHSVSEFVFGIALFFIGISPIVGLVLHIFNKNI